MASNSDNTTKKHPSYVTYDPSLASNTTFVHADPSNFRAVVQHLTGSSSSSTITQLGTLSRATSDVGVFRNATSFKLHERRQAAMRKLEMIKLKNEYHHQDGPLGGLSRPRGGCNEVVGDMVSPVSTLDGLGLGLGSPSPRTSPIMRLSEEEERAIIVRKGFYMHPFSPSTPTESKPQLLPLFPLHSP